MEADPSYNSEEAQPPSCITPNVTDGKGASLVYMLNGLAEGISYKTSFNYSSFECTSTERVLVRYSSVSHFSAKEVMPANCVKQSSNLLKEVN